MYFPPQLPNPGTPSSIADQNDLFSLELKYDNPLTGYEIPAQPQKNGNISQLWWRVRGRATEAWGLEYDYLNRLTQAKHVAADDGGAKIMGQYSEKITYADARGNIAAIQRYGVIPGASYPSGMIDDLLFTIKPGELDRHPLIKAEQLFSLIFQNINGWYNPQRIHSALNGKPPWEVFYEKCAGYSCIGFYLCLL